MSTDRLLDLRKVMQALNGTFTHLGTISATTTSGVNSFSIPAGSMVLIQVSAPVFIKPGTAATTVGASGSDGIKLDTDEKYVFTLGSSQTHIAAMTASGTSSVKVFRLS